MPYHRRSIVFSTLRRSDANRSLMACRSASYAFFSVEYSRIEPREQVVPHTSPWPVGDVHALETLTAYSLYVHPFFTSPHSVGMSTSGSTSGYSLSANLVLRFSTSRQAKTMLSRDFTKDLSADTSLTISAIQTATPLFLRM